MAHRQGVRTDSLPRFAEVPTFRTDATGPAPSRGVARRRRAAPPIRVAGVAGGRVLPRRSRRGPAFATGQV